MQSLVPFLIPMKVDLTPWLDWIEEHGMVFSSSWVTANMAIGEILATSMSTWANDWEQKLGYSAQQAEMFMDEWSYVLAAPCLAMYRQSSMGITQLNKLAFKIYSANERHLGEIREQWAYTTLSLLPDPSVCAIAFLAWSETTPEARQALNPKWAQWYDLFGDAEGFLQCVRQEGMLSEEMLPLPDPFHAESLAAP